MNNNELHERPITKWELNDGRKHSMGTYLLNYEITYGNSTIGRLLGRQDQLNLAIMMKANPRLIAAMTPDKRITRNAIRIARLRR